MEQLEKELQNNKSKIDTINATITHTELLHINLQHAIKPLMELMQNILMEFTSIQFEHYVNSMNTVKNLWKSTETQLLKLKQSKNINTHSLQQIVNNEIKQTQKMDEEYDEQFTIHSKNIIEFYVNSIKMKSFIQQLYGVMFAMERNLAITPSVLLISTKYSCNDTVDEKSESKKEKEFDEYGLFIFSHGWQYVDAIEQDLRERIKNVRINKLMDSKDDSEIINGKIDVNALDFLWDDISTDCGLVDVFEKIYSIELDDIAGKILKRALCKENEKVICWKLEVDHKESYNYSIPFIIGPVLMGKMVYKYFPDSLNSKYLKWHEMITKAYVEEIRLSMNTKQIVPVSITELIEMFFKTTFDEYPFGCLAIRSFQ